MGIAGLNIEEEGTRDVVLDEEAFVGDKNLSEGFVNFEGVADGGCA